MTSRFMPSGRTPLVLVLSAVVLLLDTTVGRGQQPAEVGAVEALVGQATATPRRGPPARMLEAGSALFAGDRVATADGARVRLALQDGSTITLGEQSELTLELALYAPQLETQSVVMRLSRGIVRTLVELLVPHSRFEMYTNTAVISVRGTEWITEAEATATTVLSLTGEVVVQNVARNVTDQVVVGPGEGVTVESRRPPPAPNVWAEARRQRFIERTTPP